MKNPAILMAALILLIGYISAAQVQFRKSINNTI